MRVAMIAVGAALAVIAPSPAFAQESWVLKQGQHRLDFPSKDTANLTGGMLLFLPKGYDQGKWPLIVFLHGRGEVGTDPEQMRHRGLPQLVEKQPDFKFIVATPQAVASAAWFDPVALDAFLDVLLARLPMVDASRIYLFGMSMGSRGAWEWAAAYPGRFAAVVPIGGAMETDRACDLKTAKVWAFHNDRDFVAPVASVQKLVDAVNACGGSVRFTVFPNREQHNAWNAAYASPELWAWLLSNKRSGAQ